jgi:hypothetical protein
VIPLAERAIETGSPRPVAEFLTGVLRHELERRLERVQMLAAKKDCSVRDARRYVEAMLGFEVYGHHVFQALQAPADQR